MRRFLSICLSLVALSAVAADDGTNPDTEIWRKVRADLFGARAIENDAGKGRIVLDIPVRAADAAVVPLAIHVRPAPGGPATKKLYVIIDRNPSPIAGIFEFGSGSGGPDLETRVRIEEYTWVRVIAEQTDGSLLVAQRFIKAAGGCSAPAGKSMAERLAGMGQMKWRIDPSTDPAAPVSVQLMIRHPNNSGLAMDQSTHLYDPPYYVRHVRVTQGDDLVFAADVDFSISENPAFRFTVPAGKGGALRAQVIDSNERSFESSAP
jgi:sulfur-oxidizing protein SoxY